LWDDLRILDQRAICLTNIIQMEAASTDVSPFGCFTTA
jgi:hypothetical protein